VLSLGWSPSAPLREIFARSRALASMRCAIDTRGQIAGLQKQIRERVAKKTMSSEGVNTVRLARSGHSAVEILATQVTPASVSRVFQVRFSVTLLCVHTKRPTIALPFLFLHAVRAFMVLSGSVYLPYIPNSIK